MRPPTFLLIAGLATSLGLPASASAVSVSPAPGTPTASYETQLSFRDVAPGELGTIRVTGSRSGRHPGRVRAHSDGRGASLLFADDFRRGERVSVATSLAIAGARDGDFAFRVADIGQASKVVRAPRPSTETGRGPRERYRSRPDLAPPTVSIQRPPSGGTAPGLVFLNARNRMLLGQQGPMIVDDRGELVYFSPVGRKRVADVRVQELAGRPVLTWWEGFARSGSGAGVGRVLDQGYRNVSTVRAGNGYRLDLHEFRLTPQGTALTLIYNPIRRDFSKLGGSSRGQLVDGIVQEVELDTGLVRFEWHSIGNVALSESYGRPSRSAKIAFDYFHANSVSIDTDGDLLVGARDTAAVYKVDRETGRIVWRLGGKESDFEIGPGATFSFQHDVERQPDGSLTLFDNATPPPIRRGRVPTRKRSRAIALDVDERAMTARLRRAITHPRGLLTANQGSFQLLPNGNVFVGWGSQRAFTEHAPDGRTIFDGRQSTSNESYRAERMPWTALPARGRPALAAQSRGDERTAVYASFNGATEVATWEVLAGPAADELAPVASARRTGFETAISAPTAGPFFAVRAKDAGGAVLGTSRAERRATGD